MRWERRVGWLVAVGLSAVMALGVSGCGTPGAPQAPTLNLPEPVRDLVAVRTGDQVTLTWTMPRRNTDKLLLKGQIAISVCRSVAGGPCEAAGQGIELPAATPGMWTETLPGALASGSPRVLRYFVEAKNARRRSAGESNGAAVLAGTAPAPVTGFRAELHKRGVAVHWNAGESDVAVRLERRLVSAPKPAKSETGPLAPEQQPTEVRLLVRDGTRAGGALDKSAELGDTYEYRAQRVVMVDVGGKMLELAGEETLPLRVEVSDIFPPDAPKGLAAVGSRGAGGEVSIDLNWQANGEDDLAGYVVYRREGEGGWARISAATPVVGPAYHDTAVVAGHTYEYAVTAVDKSGHESERSGVAEESVPSS